MSPNRRARGTAPDPGATATTSVTTSETLPTIGDLVEVADVDTVVRLDQVEGCLDELVLTGDVLTSLSAVLKAASGTSKGLGGAFFVVGPFGSGKSHFLAALGELLANPNGAHLVGWETSMRQRAATLGPLIAVRVPLVEYRAQANLEDVVAIRAWKALGKEQALGEQRIGSSVDRSATWDGILQEALETGREGLVILIDELSEFLRAKQGSSLTEDLRFLQFLGEWAARHPVVVVAALQESIEEVANVSQRELARIRDRYPVTLSLSMAHVEDLVRGRLVKLRSGSEKWLERLQMELQAAHLTPELSLDRLQSSYPLHPDTLRVLEGLRFLLSQQRGVVAFVCNQLRDDLERPYSELVTPERIYDHFFDRLRERPETSRVAEAVVPYYERTVRDIFDLDDQILALRVVKLLSLLAASPLERPRSAAELSAMLLVHASDLDPSANTAYLEEAILGPLVDHGAFVVSRPGHPRAYEVEVGADAALVVRRRVEQLVTEINPADRRVVATLSELGSSPSLPLALLGELGPTLREILWQNTLRALYVCRLRVLELTGTDVEDLLARSQAAGAEGCLVVAELEPAESSEAIEVAHDFAGACDRLAVWVPNALSEEETKAVVEMHATLQVMRQAEAEGAHEQAEILSRAEEHDAARAREIVRRAYFEGTVVYPTHHSGSIPSSGAPTTGASPTPPPAPSHIDLPSLAGLPFEKLLPILADPLLGMLHPGHRQIAPRAELVGERILRQLVFEVIPAGRLSAAALARDRLRPLVEGYLVPLGLARVRADGAVIAPDPGRGPAVVEALRLVGDSEPVKAEEVVHNLSEGWLGLSEPEAVLVLNAAVQAGLLEMWRGRRRLSEPFIAITGADRLAAGELVDSTVRSALPSLGPVVGPGPFDPWNAAVQRTTWQYANTWLAARADSLAQVRAGMAHAYDVPVLAGAATEEINADIAVVTGVTEACAGISSSSEGLSRLVDAVEEPAVLISASQRIEALARFFRDDLRRLEEAAAYISHPELILPPDDRKLEALYKGVMGRLRDVLTLVVEERTAELFAALRELRTAYVAAYQEAHDSYYSAVGPHQLNAVCSSYPYRALSAFASMRVLAVADDKVSIDRLIAASAPRPCGRRADLELAWKPRCTCGFTMGTPAPSLDVKSLTALMTKGVQQYMAELARPEHRERLERAEADLYQLGRGELAERLGKLKSLAVDVATGKDIQDDLLSTLVDDILSADLVEVVRDVLTGSQLVVSRDIGVLRDSLVGRRYTKRRLMELLAQWLDPQESVPPTGFVEVLDTGTAQGDQDTSTAQGSGISPLDIRTPGIPLGPNGSSGIPLSTSSAPSQSSSAPTLSGFGSQSLRPESGTSYSPSKKASSQEARSATVEFLQKRYPGIAASLPEHHSAQTFWLAAWWQSLQELDELGLAETEPPAWLPANLLRQGRNLVDAALSAVFDSAALAELAEIDSKVSPKTVIGDRITSALDMPSHSAEAALTVVRREHLLRMPLQLAANELAGRLAGNWQLAQRLADLDPAALASSHALVDQAELASLGYLLEAARHLAFIERSLDGIDAVELIEGLFPEHVALVPVLLSRAELASAARSILSSEAVSAFAVAARRILGEAEAVGANHADAGFPGCLKIWEVGRNVLAPLLHSHGRVAVLVIDAMRVDLGKQVAAALARMLPGRPLRWSVAEVPAPTRTAESMASMACGMPVPAGSTSVANAGDHRSSGRPAPFAHLGYESAVLARADRDDQRSQLYDLWSSGPPLSIAIATAVDERLHRTSVEPAALLDDAMAALSRRALPSLMAVPAGVPIVVLADHGFKENPAWGRGPEGRYTHGGASMEESVVPVIVLGAQGPLDLPS